MHKLFKTRQDLFFTLLIFFLSVLSVVDLFMNTGRSANMDGIVHTTMPAIFSQALREGEFPVSWTDGFSNYGLPLGIIAQQLTTYLTAFINLVVSNPVLSFNIVGFIGILLSNIFFYIFLRIYVKPVYAFLGVVLFTFAPYRILNLYIRGAMPEFFASVFMPLLLIGAFLFIKKRNIQGFFLLSITTALLTLTHPFMIIVGMLLLFPYVLFLILQEKHIKLGNLLLYKQIGFIILSVLLGLGIASYFIIPLTLEIKYFYYGMAKNHLTPNNFLTLKNFFDPNWYYFTKIDLLQRGFVVNVGLIETFTFLCGLAFVIRQISTKKNRELTIMSYAVIAGLIILFLTSNLSSPVYRYISVLSNIQFPWRMLSAFIFIPPIILAVLVSKINRLSVVIILVLLICVLRFPQLYGKNYVLYPQSSYLFTPLNLHAVVMNPIWTQDSITYPIKKNKIGVLEGTGIITNEKIHNVTRSYTIDARNPMRMIDYTFYFPGWKAYVDGVETPIEFQDIHYRGVITYRVPTGTHTVLLRFEDTRVRKISKIASIIFILLTGALFLFRKRYTILYT